MIREFAHYNRISSANHLVESLEYRPAFVPCVDRIASVGHETVCHTLYPPLAFVAFYILGIPLLFYIAKLCKARKERVAMKSKQRTAACVFSPTQSGQNFSILQRLLRWGIALGAVGIAVSCGQNSSITVTSIDILDFGILEFAQAARGEDPTSSVGAPLARAQGLRVSQRTDRIPLRSGLDYGVAFAVRGAPNDSIVDVKVVLRSTSPCRLKTTGEVVYHNDSVLRVKLDEIRYIGARIVEGDDNHCVDTPGPGTETFEIYYGGRKFAEKSFQIVQG